MGLATKFNCNGLHGPLQNQFHFLGPNKWWTLKTWPNTYQWLININGETSRPWMISIRFIFKKMNNTNWIFKWIILIGLHFLRDSKEKKKEENKGIVTHWCIWKFKVDFLELQSFTSIFSSVYFFQRCFISKDFYSRIELLFIFHVLIISTDIFSI